MSNYEQTNCDERYEPMNYFAERQGFHDSLLTNSLHPNAINLWHALIYIANKTMWKKEFSVAISTLEQETGLKKQAILNARNQLVQKNYISVKRGRGNQSATYSMISLAHRGGASPTQAQSHTQTDTQAHTQSQAVSVSHGNTINNNTKQDKTVLRRERTESCEFKAPSLCEVEEYCKERGNSIDAERFVDYYTACGWRIGGTQMSDWRAAVRIWESRERGDERRAASAPKLSSFDTDDFFEAAVRRSYEEM